MNRYAIFILCALLAFSACFGCLNESNPAYAAVIPKNGAYVPHAPIRIDSNADFAGQATAESWSGNGTVWAPYIIENYEINGSGLGD